MSIKGMQPTPQSGAADARRWVEDRERRKNRRHWRRGAGIACSQAGGGELWRPRGHVERSVRESGTGRHRGVLRITLLGRRGGEPRVGVPCYERNRTELYAPNKSLHPTRACATMNARG